MEHTATDSPKYALADRRLVVFTRVFAAFPLLAVGALASFVVRARWVLGVWPEPYRPDPKSLDAPFHLMVTWSAQGLALFAPVVVLLALAMRMAVPAASRSPLLRDALLLVIAYGLWLVLVVIDPGHFTEWLAD